MCAFFRRAVALAALFMIPSLSSLAREPEKKNVLSVYNELVTKAKGLSNPKPQSDYSSAFASYPFVLWDYAEDISSALLH